MPCSWNAERADAKRGCQCYNSDVVFQPGCRKASCRSADRKLARCAPERHGWRLGSSAISGKHFLAAMLESSLKRGRQRKRPRMRSRRRRAKTRSGEGAEDGHCEMRMVCITLAMRPRFTSTWVSSIMPKRCRSFRWRSCTRPLCNIRGFPLIGGFCIRVECQHYRKTQAAPATRSVLPSRRWPGGAAARMAVMELQSLSASHVPTALRSHGVQASGTRRAQCGYAESATTPFVCAMA